MDEVAWQAILVATVVLALWLFVLPTDFSLRIPLVYGDGDSLQLAMYVRRVLDTPWFPFGTELLGAPFHAAEYDYPENEALNYLLLKSLGAFADGWPIVANLYILSGFVLSAISAYWLLRWLSVQPAWAVAGAVLFAFLPYHFMRLAPFNHLLLASYWNVPIAAWLALRCWPDPDRAPRLFPDSALGRILVAGGILAVGAAGIYYAFFACFFICIAGIAAAVARRSARALLPAAQTTVAICIVVAIQLSPSAYFRWSQGSNPEAAARAPAESEVTGLKIVQMLLPQPRHPIPAAREIANRYATASPLTNENQAAALGLFGSLGLILLGANGFVRMARGGGAATMRERLALLAGAAILLGTVGGLGAIFALTISPLIRSYNRISIFIGLFSIAALMLWLDAKTAPARAVTGARRIVQLLLASGIAIAGLWDQTSRFDQGAVLASFQSDREFVNRFEQALPTGTMVYQLPYHPYPETGPAWRMLDYDLLRGYLHASSLRWSYGGMKGRESDRWLRTLSMHPLGEQLDLAAESGFGAVYVDRRAYPDRGAAVEAILRERLGPPLATSADGHLVTYRLAPTGKSPLPLERLRIPMSEPIQLADRDFPRYVARVEGFSGREPWGRWTDGPVARIRFAQPLPPRFTLALDIARVYGPNRDQPVGVRIGDEERTFTADGPATVEFAFDLRRPADTIEFAIPQPASPYSRGESGDRRALGIGLGALHIVPGP